MSDPVHQGIALRLQIAAICGQEREGYVEIRPLKPDGRIDLHGRSFLPVGDTKAIVACVDKLAPTHDVFLAVAPRTRQSGKADAVARVWCLWADLDGRDALVRLRDFRPLPSIVIRSGSPDCAHAYWPLKRSLEPSWARRANRRLALALGGDMTATDPARILRPAGSLNHKHEPPIEVVCTRLEFGVFEVARVVGGLPDAEDYTPVRVPDERPRTGDPSRLLAGLTRTVAEAPEGNRNSALYWSARRVREHVDQAELNPSEAVAELQAAALQTGLPEFEIERTIHSAMSAGAVAA